MDSKLAEELHALKHSHRYDQYLVRYASAIEGLNENARLEHMGAWVPALLALGRYPEALNAAELFHRSGMQSPSCARDLGRGLIAIGACQWMLGRQLEATDTWRRSCEGLRSGKYSYATDAAGGVKDGVLLWFAACSMGDEASLVLARRYLEGRIAQIAKLDALEVWPAPVARHLLSEISAEEMFSHAGSSLCSSSVELIAAARGDLMIRRRACAALFAAGTRNRQLRRVTEAMDMFRATASLENPILEVEWYLACHEISAADAADADA